MPPDAGGLLGLSDGGEEEDRTPDLRIANATLSQLSYPPTEAASLANGPAPALRRIARLDSPN